MERKIERKSNIELLRIISIIMVITLHYLDSSIGGVLGGVKANTFNYYLSYTLESFSIIAVNLFIISSSWFLIKSTKVKISKIIRLILLAYFYGAIFYIFSVLVGFESFNFKIFIKEINPFLIGKYWFVIMYSILYLIHPYLNKLLENINQKQHKFLIIILIIFYSIWPSFLPYGPNNDGGYGIISFVMLYVITHYVKKYRISFKNNLAIYVACMIVVTIVSSLKMPLASPWAYNFIFNIIGSFALFLCFVNLNIQSKIVNYISTYSFPIYLIHFNSFIVSAIYYKVLKISDFYNSKYLIIHMVISILIIYLISFTIEFIRRCILKILSLTFKSINLKLKNYEKKINEKVNNYMFQESIAESYITRV